MNLKFFHSKKKEFLLAIITSIFTLILFVGVMEWSYWKKNKNEVHTQFDSEIGWVPIKGKKIIKDNDVYSYNSMGFRSEEVDLNKPHILILGDSVAWGYDLGNDETFSHFLGKKFSRYQILNMAVNGYGIDQYYLYLKRNIDQLNPKLIVIVIYTGNDFQNTRADTTYGKSKSLFKLVNGKPQLSKQQISRFSCANLFSGSWFLQRSFFTSFKDSFCNVNYLSFKETKRVIKALLWKIKSLAELSGSQTLFVLSPSLYDLKLEICKTQKKTQFCQMFMKVHLDQHKNDFSAAINQHPESFPIDPDLFQREQVMAIKQLHRLNWGALSVFQKILESQEINYFNYFREILASRLKIYSVLKLYQDTHHYSALGNERLAKVIHNVIQINKNLRLPLN